ncbi:alpha/beta hydrolase [Rhodococcus sp. GB-02]
MSPKSNPTVLFIHGLWMHPTTWDPWAQVFNTQGYPTMAPGWPGDASTVGETREHPEDIAGHGIDDVTDHYAKVIADLDEPPIVVGHSFGGLIAQKLLGQKLATAAIAIDPAQPKGVLKLPSFNWAASSRSCPTPGITGRHTHTTESRFTSPLPAPCPRTSPTPCSSSMRFPPLVGRCSRQHSPTSRLTAPL